MRLHDTVQTQRHFKGMHTLLGRWLGGRGCLWAFQAVHSSLRSE
jgi:hypothetical protein